VLFCICYNNVSIMILLGKSDPFCVITTSVSNFFTAMTKVDYKSLNPKYGIVALLLLLLFLE
jgi:hypothetical protein